MVLVPLTGAVLANRVICEVRCKTRWVIAEDVEPAIEVEGQCADRAQFDVAMADSSKLIDTTILIMLRVISNCDESLGNTVNELST